MGASQRPIPSATMNMLMAHSWPGNVRELRNAAERYALGLAEPLMPRAAPEDAETPFACRAGRMPSSVRSSSDAWSETGGRISAVIERLDIPRRTLSEKMARSGHRSPSLHDTDGPNPADDSAPMGGKLPIR